jgi:hypothetical protein
MSGVMTVEAALALRCGPSSGCSASKSLGILVPQALMGVVGVVLVRPRGAGGRWAGTVAGLA